MPLVVAPTKKVTSCFGAIRNKSPYVLLNTYTETHGLMVDHGTKEEMEKRKAELEASRITPEKVVLHLEETAIQSYRDRGMWDEENRKVIWPSKPQ